MNVLQNQVTGPKLGMVVGVIEDESLLQKFGR
jgi:hypothetical protein